MTTTDTQPEQDNRYLLTAQELALTEAKVTKLNDRAARRGWTGHLVLEAERVETTEVNDGGIEVTKVEFAARITGQAPKYNGWEFLAVLDWYSAGGELITRVAPGVELDGIIDRTALVAGACDHCGLVRDRKDIYLVRSESGETKQVGSTCLKDFLGWNTSLVFVYEDETDSMFRDVRGSGGWVDYDTETVLMVAWALIKANGFRPASFDGRTTKGDTLQVLDPRSPEARKLAADILPTLPECKAQVAQIREFILSDQFTGGSEYVVNLKVALAASYVTARLFGLVVSAPQAWAKAIERDLTRKAQRAELVNEFVGQPKDKLAVKVTVKSIRFIDNGYGVTTLYTMVSDTGHLFKWFSTRPVLGEEVTGELLSLTGTVKAHDTYEGTRSTVLTRCKLA